MNNTTIDYRNPNFVRKAGMTALRKELGTVGATYFLRQFSMGEGDYTRERDALFDGITFDEMVRSIRELDCETAET
jgi:hypothetical protein